ncbi:hypothetical protein, conserved [Eimeria brunetti]|uniref:Uncharacterized protein n=1 Tax=Eimeria brunetti TaxID=51314 RepID=U6LNE4_9EIME|nr:hypothetical protein, conserved [Eimeria brunetti]
MLPSDLHDQQQHGRRQNSADTEILPPHWHNKDAEELLIVSNPYAHQDAWSPSQQKNRPLLLSLAGKNADRVRRSIVEDCVALEAELGVLQQRAISRLDTDPISRVEGLASMLRNAAAEFESIQEVPPWAGTHAPHLVPARAQPQTGGEQPILENMFQPVNYEAFMGTAPSFASPAGHGPLGVGNALDPGAWLDDIPDINSRADEQGKPQMKPFTFRVFRKHRPTSAVALRPIRSAADRPGAPSRYQMHPSVRLPVLAKGVLIRRFGVDSLFNQQWDETQLYFSLLRVRSLFAKGILYQQDVDALVAATELLVGAAWSHAHRPFRRRSPMHAAETLGHDFLALDAIVAVAQLLGDSMELPRWWDKFIAPFDRDTYSLLPPTNKRAGGLYRRMVNRLLLALETYKKAKRPPLSAVVSLKQMLFCTPEAPGRFKEAKWDPWRGDANCA